MIPIAASRMLMIFAKARAPLSPMSERIESAFKSAIPRMPRFNPNAIKVEENPWVSTSMISVVRSAGPTMRGVPIGKTPREIV